MEFVTESRFTSEFFAGNRQRLRELFTGTAPIVITANGLLQKGGDNTFAFAQDANFWYLTGIDEPDVILVMDRDKEYLIVPELSQVQRTFDGAIVDEALSRRSGIDKVYSDKAGWEQLAGRLKKVKHAATVAPAPGYIDDLGFYTNPARARLVQRMKTENEAVELLDLAPHLSRLRMIKQPEELAAIQAAIDITNQTLKEILAARKLAGYGHEYEVEAELTRGFRRRASDHAFTPIVASGERACTIHYLANNGSLAADELLLLDVGAEVEHYAADLARTVAVSTPTRRQQTIYEAVADVQAFAIDLLKPGTLLKEYEASVEHYMGEKLRELGLIKTISHENVRHYFPHATSHFLGLNVHDVGDYNRPLEPDVVLTVEPGIYIPEEAIGVRIEDDILITPQGNKILSNSPLRKLSS